MYASKSMARVITKIAAQHGMNLTEVGAALSLRNEPWTRLAIEVIAPGQVSVAHYVEINGDLCPDPEIVFSTNVIEGAGWVPIYSKMLYQGREYTAGRVNAAGQITHYNPGLSRDILGLANPWARTLHEQGWDNPTRTTVADKATAGALASG